MFLTARGTSGPFMALFRSDFRTGVALLNRMLNHAARIRSGVLQSSAQARSPLLSAAGPCEFELAVLGTPQLYVGDQHVWRWYRGNAVGPSPCFSALQALELVCDQLIRTGFPIGPLVSTLLDGCENLAMVGFAVGFLVRHLDRAERLLDPYLTEPFVWQLEFARLVHEEGGLSAPSDGLLAPERRKWSLQNAAMFLVANASDERVAELRALGDTLVDNARRLVDPRKPPRVIESQSLQDLTDHDLVLQTRLWASSLNRDNYQVQQTDEGVSIDVVPPSDVVESLQATNDELAGSGDSIRLILRYGRDPAKGMPKDIPQDELEADIGTAQELLQKPPSLSVYHPLDTSALVAATALRSHLVMGAQLSDDAISFAAELLLQVAEVEVGSRFF